MKSRIFFRLVLTSLMMQLIMACTSEFNSDSVNGMADVAFSINVENASVNVRSISDGTGADQLMWGIFSEDGELVLQKSVKNDVTDLLSAGGHSMYVTLAKGKTYKAVFWAQNSTCEAYTVSDDMKVTIDYNGINNDESRDAFFASSEPFTVDGSTVVTVVLKRPFAQINLGAFPWDMEYAVESGMKVALSGAHVTGVPNVIDLFDGTVEGEVDVTYAPSSIPQEVLYVDVNEDGADEEYDYISMSYILAAPESSVHAMSFTLSDLDSGVSTVFESGLSSVPVKRNWRTNIVGQILTGEMTFNIKIDPSYDGKNLNSGGLYYNFTTDTDISDKLFAFNTYDAATFTSENNNLLTFNDVEFTGMVQFIAFGEYRDKGNYINFRNDLNNVTTKDMVVSHSVGIANVETVDYMAPLVFLRGENTLTNCSFTGTTSIAPDKTDYNKNVHPVLPYDCGIPNNCSAVFENCTVDRLYAWSHSQVTLNNSTLKYIRCSTHKKSYDKAHLTIGPGTVVDEIVVSSSGLAKFVKIDGVKTLTAEPWSPSLIIKSGATVKKLDLNGRPDEDVLIEDGAIVQEIVNKAE